MSFRRCMTCEAAIENCNGAVLPRDICAALAGQIPWTEIRELCGACALTFDSRACPPHPLGLVGGQ